MKTETKRLAIWALVISAILAIPLVGMQFSREVQWSLADFVIMGAVLSGIALAYEGIARKSGKALYRVAFGVGLLGAFLLFWVNAAVGIIGNEGQDANLLFGLVFLVGLFGALLCRFRPGGMAATLFSAAAVQMLVPVIALLLWPPSEISWSPGVFRVFVLSGFFAAIFAVSGMLFRWAASNPGPGVQPARE